MVQFAGAASRTVVLPAESIAAEKTTPPPMPVSPTEQSPPAEHDWGTIVVVVVAANVVVVAGTQGEFASLKRRMGRTCARSFGAKPMGISLPFAPIPH
jgi:hypothetical protein